MMVRRASQAKISLLDLFGKFSSSLKSAAIPSQEAEQDEKDNCKTCNAADNATNDGLLCWRQSWTTSVV